MSEGPKIEWRVDEDTAVYLVDGVGMHFRKVDDVWHARWVEAEFYEAINDYSPGGFNTSDWMSKHSTDVKVRFDYDIATWVATPRK